MSKLIKNSFIRHRKTLLVIFSIALAVLSLFNLYYIIFVTPTSNDECLWRPMQISRDSLVLVFDDVKVGGVTWNAGIRNGDILIAIADTNLVNNTNASMRILNRYKEGDYAEYTVKRNDDIFKTKVYIKKLINFPNLGFGLLVFVWLIVGFIVIMSKPDGVVQKYFYLIGVAGAIFMSAVLVTSPIEPKISFETIFVLITILARVYFSFLFVYFFWIFPKPFSFTEKKLVKLIFFILPLILGILQWSLSGYFISTDNISALQILGSIFTYLLLAGLITGCISLIINYRRLNPRERKPIILILVSYILGIASIIYTFILSAVFTGSLFNSPHLFTPIILLVMIPIAFAVSIFKYQLMDVGIIVKNAIMYGTATASLAILYFLVIYLLGQSISSAIGTEYQGIIAGGVFVIFALIFQSTKDRFQDLLTKRFYPEQFSYQQVLIKFSNELPALIGLDNILDSISNIFSDTLRLDKFIIFVSKDKNTHLSLVRHKGINFVNTSINYSEKLNEILRHKKSLGEPLIFEQANFKDAFPEHFQWLIDEKIYTIMPMIIKSKIVGLIGLGLKPSGTQFAGKDLFLLSALANQSAVSIENARLYEEEALKISMEKDLETARKIQQGLLPKSIPKLEGLDICGEMIPALQVGGDYYDLIQVTDDKIFVLVGDVSGKGLPASLYMTRLQGMFQLYCVDGRTPKEILIDINKKLFETLERNWFVTLSLALFDTHNNTLKYCRAGHTNLIHFKNGEPFFRQPTGIGLGLESGEIFSASLEEGTITYSNDEVFVFYSDGVTEAMNSQHELFGLERLSKIIASNLNKSSTEILNEVINQINIFRDDYEQNDDISIVVIKTY